MPRVAIPEGVTRLSKEPQEYEMKKYYAGIGSRQSPPDVLTVMERLGHALARTHILRSGAADGADAAFERGALAGQGTAEIFLPWRGFNGHSSTLTTVSAAALALAKTVHPAWERLGEGPRKLHARNMNQVLGESLSEPVEFVACWTPDGCESERERRQTTGGTASAIVLASRHGIPVFNLQKAGRAQALAVFLAERGVEFVAPALASVKPQQSSLF